MLANGFLLGLANGGACLAACAAVLIPLFLGEGRKTAENGGLLARFLAGRLTGYLLFGLLAWAAHWLLLLEPAGQSILFGLAYFGLAGLMLAYGLGRLHVTCALPARPLRARFGKNARLRPWLPALFGLLTGLNLCPPLLLAFTNAALNGTLLGSMGFFLAFFAGTTLYLLPVPLVGLLGKANQSAAALQAVGRLTAALMAGYYLLSGITMFVEGILL